LVVSLRAADNGCYTPLADCLDTASSNRGSTLLFIICAAENSRVIATGRSHRQQQPRRIMASLRKPPTTDEHTPLAELLTPPVATMAVLLASLSAAKTAE
jgi:hypothetical protein